ncbi:gamma-glutamyl-gamma-aminobutyrate hydrolase family protein [Pseudothermotoga sp. U03pept]|uniref:gamma-glutamyl-gamma-aminobutyrate hydrolase family protein n=1 Tax=Pseudothermotoga sp. U03pept TaxID=3447012 RepID=UPI003F0939EF
MKPTVGITCSVDENSSKLNETYYKAVEKAGALPFMIPLYADKQNLQRLAEILDGIIFSGGFDLDPKWYDEQPRRGLGTITPSRDEQEIELCKVFFRIKKPIFGICRGIQLINVALGGSLYQDIYSECENTLKHSQDAPDFYPTHKIYLQKDSFLQKLFGKDELSVNSFHHQAVKKVSPLLKAVAHAQDKIVEAIERVDDEAFILAVQWHPERMVESFPEQLKLFEAFVESCRKGKKK